MELQENYIYCINQDTCIHRRGCKRWIGNYSEEDAIKLSNETIEYVDDYECTRGDYDCDNIKYPFDMLDRFRLSDGTEFEEAKMFIDKLEPTNDYNRAKTVVRLTTSYYGDKRSGHVKKTLTTLKRKSNGYDLVVDEINQGGAEEALTSYTNLFIVEDGIYEVVPSYSRDFETGYIDDVEFTLKPYEE